MDEKTIEFMKRVFKQYYFRVGDRIEAPKRIEEREFGYIPFGGSMIRHLSFKTAGELRAFIVREAPHSIYYSTAYYQEPTLPMQEKGWMGGDLAFDIDADTLAQPCRREHDIWICKSCGAKGVGVKPEACPSCGEARIQEVNFACSRCLEAAKQEAVKLIEILTKDLGVKKHEIKTYFSGNLGYHVVVESEEFEELDQAARGEIVDYVMGRGLMPESIGVFKQATYEEVVARLPYKHEPGWRGRLASSFEEWRVEGFEGGDVREKIAALYGKIRYSRFKKRLEKEASRLGAVVDAMVTTDVHRIFRMPGTLHGETGLLKKRCEDLAGFDPLVEAAVLGDEPIDVWVDYSPKFTLKGYSYPQFKQERVKLPTHAAIYLMGKGLARVADGG